MLKNYISANGLYRLNTKQMAYKDDRYLLKEAKVGDLLMSKFIPDFRMGHTRIFIRVLSEVSGLIEFIQGTYPPEVAIKKKTAHEVLNGWSEIASGPNGQSYEISYPPTPSIRWWTYKVSGR